MPKAKSNIGRHTRQARFVRTAREQRTEDQRLQDNENSRAHMAQFFQHETPQHRSERLHAAALRQRELRQRATDANRESERQRNRRNRQLMRSNLNRLAFEYDPEIDYSSHTKVVIGDMDRMCQYCNALKFHNETNGMCCASGKVVLPALNPPPEPLKSLISGVSTQSKLFLSKIRKFNSCFQMTSFGATVRENTGFESTFKIQGQVYHRIGSMLPMPNADPKFLQIFFMGEEEEQVGIRCHYNHIAAANEREIVALLQTFLHENNLLVRLFKEVSPRLANDNYMVVIRPEKAPADQHSRRFNTPTINDVAIVMVGEQFEQRDIRIMRRDNTVQTIQDSHRSYDALQYPIIFWEGEDGYQVNIKQCDPTTRQETNKNVSAMNYYAYRLMMRHNEDNHILKCRQLFHQYVVDMYAKIESERLRYIRFNQAKLRAEEYIHLRDAINNNIDSNLDINNIGQAYILPSSYTGSPRHMHEYIQDAMTFVRAYGRPELFITFTCNPKWEEIKKLLLPGQSALHRHDITARIFRQKFKSLIDFIVKHHVFGETRCWMYSVEWQKRGLPHAHILIWLVEKIRPEQIDNIISAEIPDHNTDPELFEIVKSNMIHGPCGDLNPSSPCMDNGKCTKRFPKDLLSDTITGVDGYPLYRRRSQENGGNTFMLERTDCEIEIDNRWVVPYSPLLSKTYKAHINVEFCSSVKSIKYICKYVHKGSDMAVFEVQNLQNQYDEISRYQMGRYISSNEAVWRILSFPIHERDPTVIHLAIHLENGQRVYFNAQNAIERALTAPKTTLTQYFELCKQNNIFGQFAQTLLYSEVPSYFTWNKLSKKWEPRKRGSPVDGYQGIFKANSLGRLYTVHPRQRECFYLRLLLVTVRGPTSFEHLRTVNGQLCATNHDACLQLKLLEDDNHWDTTVAEAALGSSANQIRQLFAILLTTCFPSNPIGLWEKYKDSMSEDILHEQRRRYQDTTLEFTEEIYNQALILIEDTCMLIASESLAQLKMISPNRPALDLANNEITREQNYDPDDLLQFVLSNEEKLTNEQKIIYERIMLTIAAKEGGFFFLDAPGGTGKTFLISLILAKIRSQGNIALAIASSGIAATLLEGGRTAHSALKLPLNIQHIENAVCNVKKQSGMAKVFKKCKIIIWDECTMAHKHSLEALNRTLKDLNDNDRLFGGALVLLSGDFRQTLPVIPRSTYVDEINACLKSSSLWRSVHTLKLTINMRVRLNDDPSAEMFAQQLLDIGNGKLAPDRNTQFVSFPENFCNIVESKIELIERVFPNIATNNKNHKWLGERAILAARNVDVDEMNYRIQDKLPGESITFRSIDTMEEENECVNYPTEFLNSLDIPGLPPHKLELKIGSTIILLRNLNAPRLCNGTRLAIKKIMGNVIEGTIISGRYKGEEVLIPRIPMIPTDVPFKFKRLQFPIRLAFAMTINKAQGQTMSVCGINLENPCFSHGQLYVACSRVGNPSNLFIHAPDGTTRNIVHELALR